MLPLDVVNSQMQLNDLPKLTSNLRALRQINVDSVNVDVWWGLVEASAPRQYNWGPYIALTQLCRSIGLPFFCLVTFTLTPVSGLKLEVGMSFHECGGN